MRGGPPSKQDERERKKEILINDFRFRNTAAREAAERTQSDFFPGQNPKPDIPKAGFSATCIAESRVLCVGFRYFSEAITHRVAAESEISLSLSLLGAIMMIDVSSRAPNQPRREPSLGIPTPSMYKVKTSLLSSVKFMILGSEWQNLRCKMLPRIRMALFCIHFAQLRNNKVWPTGNLPIRPLDTRSWEDTIFCRKPFPISTNWQLPPFLQAHFTIHTHTL